MSLDRNFIAFTSFENVNVSSYCRVSGPIKMSYKFNLEIWMERKYGSGIKTFIEEIVSRFYILSLFWNRPLTT